MRHKTRWTAVAVCFFSLFLFFAAPAWAKGMVDDAAHLLTAKELEVLASQVQKLSDDTGYDYFVVTTEDAEGKSAKDFAEDYYMDNNSTLDGVIYLIDMDNREIYIATSGIMRYYLDDERWNKILDDAYDCVSEGEYAEGFAVMLSDTKYYLDRGIDPRTYTVDENTGEITYYEPPKNVSIYELLLALGVGILAAGAMFGITVGKYKMKWGNYSYSYQNNSKLHLSVKQDSYVRKVVTQRHIPKQDPPSGGGHSSTTHTGSGGNSFGGGGRSF